MMPNVIDLFAGAGGLSLGACRAGFNVIAAVENDQQAISTHKKNFPNTNLLEYDIRQISIEDIENAAKIERDEIVGVIGGPPCQGFSTIGHGDVNDNRNTLFNRFFEIVAEIHPVFFLAENVPGIMREKYDEIRKNAFSLVRDYSILDPICVKASDYGAATSRTRYFFIGYLPQKGVSLTVDDFKKVKLADELQTNASIALEGLPSKLKYSEEQTGYQTLDKNYCDRRRKHNQNRFYYEHMTGLIPEGVGAVELIEKYKKKHITNGFLMTDHTKTVQKRYGALKYGERDTVSKSIRLNPDDFCPTLRAGTGPEKGSYQAVRPIHYSEPRVIYPREAARLQGFPDWFQLPDTIWHSFRQIGNSVSPIAAEAILKVIYDHLPDKNQ